MMSMILQVGAVPFGFTSGLSDREEGYCDLCQQRGNYFFPTTMAWQHFGNASPLPDLIPGGSPLHSQHRYEDPLQSFFPSEQFPPELSTGYYPLTPSPTPVRGKCPECSSSPHQDNPFSLVKTRDTNSTTRKVQLKLEHIQDVRQRLQEDHLFFRSYCQNQNGLPQLSWDLPPRRRQQNQQPIQQQQLTASSSSTQKRKDSNGSKSEASDGFGTTNPADSQVEEDVSVNEWRRIGSELRHVADGFHENNSLILNNRERRTLVPSYISYAAATSLFFLLSWRMISRYH